MPDSVITVENLSKRYVIGHQRNGSEGLRHTIEDAFRNPLKWLKQRRSAVESRREEFWALKDVSFEVKQGEVVGIIGRNGAGKSTLLKILSQITEPTTGQVRLKGRVASLLEVGTGFHQELTGRENIFLNGAILGMTRAEIKARFDEIVAFSEIDKFLDTPVKRYSSGMYVRLAFAVAAHLEPEILIVDEVLAVGDTDFQKKCLGKMSNVAAHGRTILFVSHDMGSIARLCKQGILLNQGLIEHKGEMSEVIAHYHKENTIEEGYAELEKRADRSGSTEAFWRSIELVEDGNRRSVFSVGHSMTIRAAVEVRTSIMKAHFAAIILTSDGVPVHGLGSIHDGATLDLEPGDYQVEITIDKLQLSPGRYITDLWLGDYRQARVDYLRNALSFHVVQGQDSGIKGQLDRRNGLVYVPSQCHCTRMG